MEEQKARFDLNQIPTKDGTANQTITINTSEFFGLRDNRTEEERRVNKLGNDWLRSNERSVN